MKKAKRLLRVLGQVDEELAEKAAPVQKKHRSSVGWISAAACVTLVAVLGVGIWQSGLLTREDPSDVIATPDEPVYDEPPVENPDTSEKDHEETFSPKPNEQPEENGVCILVPWAELSISQQYAEVTYQGDRYSSQVTALSAENRGDFLLNTTMETADYDTGKRYTQNATLYAIKGISEDCAVAVQFEGQEDYYVYTNSYYKPETLGQFIEDLNLKENLVLNTGYYQKSDAVLVGFDQIAETVVWERMLCNTELENVYDLKDWHIAVFSISIDIPILGYKNISLALTEEGYITTNILNTGKAFFIGKEQAAEILDDVLEHCTLEPLKLDMPEEPISE